MLRVRGAILRRNGRSLMSIVYFTLVAAILYLLSDRILDRVEVSAGRRFQHRSLLFFCILMTLAVTSFALLSYLAGNTHGG
jgi:membrane-anchored glycerophosphoryl diester phosphodiesterase (GDPDase)